MIQTLIEPSSLPVFDACVAGDGLSLEPQAATTAAHTSAAAATLNFFIRPSSPPRGWND